MTHRTHTQPETDRQARISINLSYAQEQARKLIPVTAYQRAIDLANEITAKNLRLNSGRALHVI